MIAEKGVTDEVLVGSDVHDFALDEGLPANWTCGVGVGSGLGGCVFSVRRYDWVGLSGLVSRVFEEEGNEFLQRELGVETAWDRDVFARGDIAFEKRGLVKLVGFQLETWAAGARFGYAPDSRIEIFSEIGVRRGDDNGEEVAFQGKGISAVAKDLLDFVDRLAVEEGKALGVERFYEKAPLVFEDAAKGGCFAFGGFAVEASGKCFDVGYRPIDAIGD